MKRKLLSILLCIAILISVSPRRYASADALTAAIVSQVSMGVASSLGFNFTTTNATGEGIQSYFESQVTDYVNSNGGSLSNLFGSEVCRLVAGNLVVGQNLYNGAVNFIDWLKDKFTNGILSKGNVGGLELGETQEGSDEIPSTGYMVKFSDPVTLADVSGYLTAQYYVDGEIRYTKNGDSRTQIYTGNWKVDSSNGNTFIYIEFSNYAGVKGWGYNFLVARGTGQNAISWSVPDSWAPQPMPQNKEWEGDFSGTPGYADPPTDLPDFLSRIPAAVAGNELDVEGQIVDVDTGGETPPPSPSPSPSPSPVYKASTIAALLAEIIALIKNLSGDTAIDQEAIDSAAEHIAESAQTIPDSITQSGTQTQTAIQEQTQTISDTASQTKEAIEEATQTITETSTQTKEAIEEATQTITEATEVPEQSKWDEVKKDLHGVFPFCIPWDIYAMLNVFNAEPKTPKFEVPFNVPAIGLDYTFDFDFKDFDQVAETLRTVELIAFCVGLAILTSKVIRW